ncbi:hypothetical protein [Methanobrevibacter arboriphilus]|uniref:Uncharacterized protein n=1 Tax=Methanobrevibacter arboriphilus TaxID=39441 RepID=A0ACA8R4Z2_METAZ|nr:hypothetical protein [Methanobrevibacter arboriphilus]BBL62386.1 hypothetical protein MarbSA_14260 [Methanobrevibacter arboriphilus]
MNKKYDLEENIVNGCHGKRNDCMIENDVPLDQLRMILKYVDETDGFTQKYVKILLGDIANIYLWVGKARKKG